MYANRGAIDDARRDGYLNGVHAQSFARPTAGDTTLGPRLTTTAAELARPADWQVERHDRAGNRINCRERNLGVEPAGCFVGRQKRVAHAIDDRLNRRKVDRDLISKASERAHTFDTPNRSG
jgi:hypothetical protein